MESETAPKLEADASLSHRIKLGYGTADFGLAAVESMVQIYLFKFYNIVGGEPQFLNLPSKPIFSGLRIIGADLAGPRCRFFSPQPVSSTSAPRRSRS